MSKLVAVSLLLICPLSASAVIRVEERFEAFTHTFGDALTFDGAMQHLETRYLNVPSIVGETRIQTFTLLNTSATNIGWVGDSHIGVDLLSVEKDLGFNETVVTAEFRSLDGQPGYSVLSSDRARSRTIENGHYVYRRVDVGGFGGVAAGFPFIVQIALPGDWSASGTFPGGHVLESSNPLWEIDENFAFNGTHTIFRAHIDNYLNDGAHDLDLTFALHGVPVPEPHTYALIAAALGVVSLAVRGKQARG